MRRTKLANHVVRLLPPDWRGRLLKKWYININDTAVSWRHFWWCFFRSGSHPFFCSSSFLFFLPSVTLFTFVTPAKLGAGGWSPLETNRNQWLQVDLGSRKQVVAIVTQGRYSSSDWTSKYRLLYSDTQKNWRPYLQDGNIWVSQNSKSPKTFLVNSVYTNNVLNAGVHV